MNTSSTSQSQTGRYSVIIPNDARSNMKIAAIKMLDRTPRQHRCQWFGNMAGNVHLLFTHEVGTAPGWLVYKTCATGHNASFLCNLLTGNPHSQTYCTYCTSTSCSIITSKVWTLSFLTGGPVDLWSSLTLIWSSLAHLSHRKNIPPCHASPACTVGVNALFLIFVAVYFKTHHYFVYLLKH